MDQQVSIYQVKCKPQLLPCLKYVFSVLSTSFCGLLFILKPWTPISPNNINRIANRQVIRIKKNIYKEIVR